MSNSRPHGEYRSQVYFDDKVAAALWVFRWLEALRDIMRMTNTNSTPASNIAPMKAARFFEIPANGKLRMNVETPTDNCCFLRK
jgi:hypothetical protein